MTIFILFSICIHGKISLGFVSLTVIGIESDTSLASLAIAAKRFRLIPKLPVDELSVLSLRLRIGIDFRALS